MTMWHNISNVAPRRGNYGILHRGLKPTATVNQPLRGEECAGVAAERQPKVVGRFNARNWRENDPRHGVAVWGLDNLCRLRLDYLMTPGETPVPRSASQPQQSWLGRLARSTLSKLQPATEWRLKDRMCFIRIARNNLCPVIH